MKSAIPKVLHRIGGRSMLAHVLAAVSQAGANRVAAVVGPDRQDAAKEAQAIVPGAAVYTQHERLGTAHAALSARESLEQGADDVVVAFGDTPLITAETFGRLRAPLANGVGVAVLGFEARDPTGYGRLLRDGDTLVAIREHKDATDEERKTTLCNAGLMALRGDIALAVLDGIGNSNAQNEYYLTDAVEVAARMGHRSVVVTASESEVQGINDRAQLAKAEADFQRRARAAAMANGATLLDPDTVFFSFDTKLGRDVVVEPNVFFGPGVVVEDDVVIHAFSHLEGARVAKGASVGPFARLRPGANLGPKAKVGNFVEIKNVDLGEGAKVSHLTYLGDATVGRDANIGAGTITCNYDGFFKYRTTIGDGAFIGSDSALVAPVRIGRDAYVGSGSVITEDVPDESLAIGRGRQVNKEGWARTFRDAAAAKKNAE
jgi:bifunctional UDP-N-acetylglucosamine pyrophosphorylase/glucosamine-1-phosphate N-acetyltransferase